VQGAASDAAAAVADAVTGAAADAQAFAAETFNYDAVVAAIDGSTLADDTKTTLKSALDAARNSPVLLEAALVQVRAALGL
jgi:uncharacterized protein YdeI (BOF family)